MKILIADDDRTSLKTLQGVLTAWGYHVLTAKDGAEAWQVLQTNEAPALAILDWMMPGLDGVEICRRLRQRQTLTPTYVILVTARTDKTDVVAGLEAGANDCITKPFDPNELQARLQVGRTVTELQAHVVLRMREFESYVEDAPLGILVVEQDGSIGFVNSRAYSLFGYTPGELVGQPIEILVPGSLRERHVELRDGFFQSPKKRLMAGRELLGQRKDNSPLPLAVGLNPILRGTTPRVVATVMDLTELRRAEELLLRFFELSLDLFAIAHVSGRLLRVNANYTRLLGYSDEELLSRPFFDIIHPEDVPSVQAQLQRLTVGEAVTDFRCRLRDSRGNDHWTEWDARSVPAEGMIYAVGRNITDRLRMENELLYRERRERAILDNTPAIIYVKGIDGRYEFVNRRHAELFSRNQETAVGKSVQDFFPEEEADRFIQNDQQIIETGKTLTVEEIVRHDDGHHTYVSVKFPLLDAGGRVCATAGISTDITEQLLAHRTEQELELARSFQSKLYPQTAPAVPGLEVAGSAIPLTQMCGDYYDYIKLGRKRLLVSIGDVSGHGVGPALQMAEVRCTIRTLARLGNDPPSIMGDLNRMLCEDLPESSFISFFLADMDLENRRLCYLGAGHDAFLIHADDTVTRLESTHPVMGIDPATAFLEMASTGLDKGDVVFLFTDGLTEARDVRDKEYGRNQAIETVRRHRQEPSDRIIQELFLSVYEFTSGRNLLDDITAVVVKIVE